MCVAMVISVYVLSFRKTASYAGSLFRTARGPHGLVMLVPSADFFVVVRMEGSASRHLTGYYDLMVGVTKSSLVNFFLVITVQYSRRWPSLLCLFPPYVFWLGEQLRL